VLSLRTNPAKEWADLRQGVVDRLDEENTALLQRLATLEADGARPPKDPSSIADASTAGAADVIKALVPPPVGGSMQRKGTAKQKDR
jgi:hypothetical protein